MPIDLWIAFVFTSAILLVVPGPTVLTVISYSMAHGRRANLPLIAAVALGDSTSLTLSLLGLGALLATSALWFAVIKTAGGLYLIYLGIRLLCTGMSSSKLPACKVPEGRGRLFANTYLITALNPKGVVFFTAFLPQFIDPGGSVTRQLWILASTFVALAVINATFYTVFAAAAARALAASNTRQGFNVAGGTLLSTAGIWTLLAGRPA